MLYLYRASYNKAMLTTVSLRFGPLSAPSSICAFSFRSKTIENHCDQGKKKEFFLKEAIVLQLAGQVFALET